MKVDGVMLNGLKPLQPPPWSSSGESKLQSAEKDFGDYLKEALRQVDEAQKNAHQSAIDMALGDEADIHKAMVTYEKAVLALQLTIEIRNKMVEAYHEIMRLQM